MSWYVQYEVVWKGEQASFTRLVARTMQYTIDGGEDRLDMAIYGRTRCWLDLELEAT